jgi:hypothetical protein
MKDSQLEALIKKTSDSAGTGQSKKRRFIDPTLEATKRPDADKDDSEKLFKEMKKREF